MDWLAAYDPEVTRRDFARARGARARLRCGSSSAGPTSSRPRTRIDAAVLGQPGRRRRRRRRGRAGAHRHAVHRPHERRELGPDAGRPAGPTATRASASWRRAPGRPGAGAAQLVLRPRRSSPPRSALAGAVAAALRRPPGACGCGISATRTPTARSRPTPRPATAWLERMTGAIRAGRPGAADHRRHPHGGPRGRSPDRPGRGRPGTATSCRCTAIRPTPPGPTGPPTTGCFPSSPRHPWLAGGAPVLFEEFGLPTGTPGGTGPDRLVRRSRRRPTTPGEALDGLRAAGCLGALLWCFADYAPALHSTAAVRRGASTSGASVCGERTVRRNRPSPRSPAEPAAQAGSPRPNCRGWTSKSSEFLADRTRQPSPASIDAIVRPLISESSGPSPMPPKPRCSRPSSPSCRDAFP